MTESQDLLRDFASLSAHERAAAIEHYIYTKTAERKGWDMRVPTQWSHLPQDAKDFNMASIETWLEEVSMYNAWIEAINQAREYRSRLLE